MDIKTEILPSAEERSVKTASAILNGGGVIVYPTETLYGIGSLATKNSSIRKIFEIKKRGAGKPLLTLVKDSAMIRKFFEIREDHIQLYEKCKGSPLTIILNQKFSFPDELSAGTGKVGVRISSNEFVTKLFEHIDVPLVSTSANISDEDNIRSIREIIDQFNHKVDLIIDSGNLPVSKGSTILDLTVNPPVIIREGDIKKEELKEFLIGQN